MRMKDLVRQSAAFITMIGLFASMCTFNCLGRRHIAYAEVTDPIVWTKVSTEAELKEALSDTEKTYVKVTSGFDVTEKVSITSDKTIDLGENTLVSKAVKADGSPDSMISISGGADVSIENGRVNRLDEFEAHACHILLDSSSLRLKQVDFLIQYGSGILCANTSDLSIVDSSVLAQEGEAVWLTGGTASIAGERTKLSAPKTPYGAVRITRAAGDRVRLEIKGGTITGRNTAVYVGGTNGIAAVVSAESAALTGGDWAIRGMTSAQIISGVFVGKDYSIECKDLAIEGGLFIGSFAKHKGTGKTGSLSSADVWVEGGTFNRDVSEYFDDENLEDDPPVCVGSGNVYKVVAKSEVAAGMSDTPADDSPFAYAVSDVPNEVDSFVGEAPTPAVSVAFTRDDAGRDEYAEYVTATETLVEDTDYTVSWADWDEDHEEATLTITGKGRFEGGVLTRKVRLASAVEPEREPEPTPAPNPTPAPSRSTVTWPQVTRSTSTATDPDTGAIIVTETVTTRRADGTSTVERASRTEVLSAEGDTAALTVIKTETVEKTVSGAETTSAGADEYVLSSIDSDARLPDGVVIVGGKPYLCVGGRAVAERTVFRGRTYLPGEGRVLRTGWVGEGGGRMYAYPADGSARQCSLASGWLLLGEWHYIDPATLGEVRGWSRGGTRAYYYYFDRSTGEMYRSRWLRDPGSGHWYWFGARGAMAHDALVAWRGRTYRLGSRGNATAAVR